uniref:Uncharacterized protein n=1 Tax=Moniliophthora roreri TaxID=221103 RepID=A0A0W0FT06_MONRR
MSKLSDPDMFQQTCASIFQRMIDTVPSTVNLSSPVEPIDDNPEITSGMHHNIVPG